MIFVKLVQLAGSAAGTIRRFAIWSLLPLFACLRFKHLNLTINLRVDGDFIRGTCQRGKRRVQRSRPAFDWACPLGVIKDKAIFAELFILQTEYERELGSTPHFIVPDITLDDQGKVSAASQLIMKPMPLAKFIRILQSFCISCGLTEAQAKCITSYALRRFLPTVAGALKIPEDMAEAVGDWQQATAARALPPAMATRYNDDRVLMAADVKTRLLMAVGQQARALNKATVSWDEMRAAFTWEDICKWQLPKFGQTTAKEALGTAEEILSDPASDSSASDSTSDSEQSIDGDGLEWFRQSNGGKYHLLQAMCASALVPWCRSVPFNTSHFDRGNGIEEGYDWCRACIQRCPVRVSNCLKELADPCRLTD